MESRSKLRTLNIVSLLSLDKHWTSISWVIVRSMSTCLRLGMCEIIVARHAIWSLVSFGLLLPRYVRPDGRRRLGHVDMGISRKIAYRNGCFVSQYRA